LLGRQQAFFEAESFRDTEFPDGPNADAGTARSQLGLQRPQGQVRLLLDAVTQPVTLIAQHVASNAAHRLGGGATGGPVPLRPPRHTGWADMKQLGNQPAAPPLGHG
jgi:hypothetical protein